jgi:type VI secretion system secreted protein Hcp
MTQEVQMAFDALINIDGIDGESSDDKHNGWIEIIQYGTGVKQTISTTASCAGGATAERADFVSFVFSKLIDKSSPILMLACAAGTHIDEIIVKLYRAGTEKIKFMEYKLKNSVIRSVLTSSGDPSSGFPVELVKIDFGRIEWCYVQQKRRGGWAAGNIAAGWDLQRNCKV